MTSTTSYQVVASRPQTSGQMKEQFRKLEKNENKIIYMNDVVGNLFCVVQKFETENEQLKQLISLLLHFKYMLKFVVENSDFKSSPSVSSEEQKETLTYESEIEFIQKNVANFKSDYEKCLSKFNSIIATDSLKFVNEKENVYKLKNSENKQYFSLKDLPMFEKEFSTINGEPLYFANVTNHLQTKKNNPIKFQNLLEFDNIKNFKKTFKKLAIENVEVVISEDEDNIIIDSDNNEDHLKSHPIIDHKNGNKFYNNNNSVSFFLFYF